MLSKIDADRICRLYYQLPNLYRDVLNAWTVASFPNKKLSKNSVLNYLLDCVQSDVPTRMVLRLAEALGLLNRAYIHAFGVTLYEKDGRDGYRSEHVEIRLLLSARDKLAAHAVHNRESSAELLNELRKIQKNEWIYKLMQKVFFKIEDVLGELEGKDVFNRVSGPSVAIRPKRRFKQKHIQELVVAANALEFPREINWKGRLEREDEIS